MSDPGSEAGVNGWRYPTLTGGRDLRIDFLRGVAMFMVVVAHIEIPSAYHFFTKERFGVVTSAEAFVLLSGLIIGLIYPGRIVLDGWTKAALKLFRRGAQLYVVSLGVAIGVYLLRFNPLLNASALYTFTDTRTGIVYDLYDSTGGDALSFIRNMLILRYGPGQFNIMGLYVVLMVVTLFVLWALEHRMIILVALISGGIYLYNAANPTRVTIAQFENAFSLLAWQALFIIGILIGYHWENLLGIARGKLGRPLVIIITVAFFVLMFYSLNNPWIDVPRDMRLKFIEEDLFNQIYAHYFSRVWLGMGRILNTLIVFAVFYVLLTHFWKGFNRVAGWFLIPIGQASLYVFVVHLFFLMLMANIPLFQENRIWVNAMGETAVLLAIWFMVRHRVLFKIIPR